MPDVLQLLTQFGTNQVELIGLAHEISTGDLSENAEAILADDAAKLGLGAALCARRKKQEGDCEDFLVDDTAYPFFDACSSNTDVDWWATAGAPSIGMYVVSLEAEAQEQVLGTVGKLVANRLWLDNSQMTDEETAAWAAIGLDMDKLKATAHKLVDDSQKPLGTEDEPDGADSLPDDCTCGGDKESPCEACEEQARAGADEPPDDAAGVV